MIFVVGGGGGLNPNKPLIHVNAPLGSTVDFTLSGVVVKSIPPSKAIPNVDGESADYYYSAVNGTYTITASLNDYARTATVTVSANDQYDCTLAFHVPTAYQEVEYIENTGQSWIDTGISPKINFSCKMRIAAASNGDGLFGIYASGGGSSYRAEVYSSSQKYALYSNASSGTTEYLLERAITFNELVDLEYEQSANEQILRGFGLVASNNAATADRDKCTFFRYIGSTTYYRTGRLNHAVIYNDGVLVRDMWSCYRKSDSVAGMWDKVSDSFITNSGTGTFSVGADVN